MGEPRRWVVLLLLVGAGCRDSFGRPDFAGEVPDFATEDEDLREPDEPVHEGRGECRRVRDAHGTGIEGDRSAERAADGGGTSGHAIGQGRRGGRDARAPR